MVQRKVLEKCTDSELEDYLKEGNRFTPEAVQMAFEMLERRGRIFSEERLLYLKEVRSFLFQQSVQFS
ncbi:hypothetical protein [Chryseobacterium camelliae]|uniref:hypothetical protein n=1 Tax=Chryseobacterium camelliae TaxID=1265445 RepID=UPI00285A1B04|nr:hypothetical protein [Chryseobacterium camelliae]MDR6513965.1 hypothetical protein [Chryseobacterium camelliae]